MKRNREPVLAFRRGESHHVQRRSYAFPRPTDPRPKTEVAAARWRPASRDGGPGLRGGGLEAVRFRASAEG